MDEVVRILCESIGRQVRFLHRTATVISMLVWIKIQHTLSQVYSQDGCTELRGFRRYSDRCCGHAMNLVWLFFMHGFG